MKSIYAYSQEGPVHEWICSWHHYETECEMIIMHISTQKKDPYETKNFGEKKSVL